MSEKDSVAAARSQALPEDIVIEILGRVSDLASLFRCSVVCKRWRVLVSNPTFLLRRRWPEGGTSLLGFFVQRNRINANARRKISRLFPSLSPVFVPAPDSVLGPARRFLTSFVHDESGKLDEAKPLVARGGLLLVRLSPHSSDRNSVLRLGVCNLLTGRFDTLPPLDASFLDDGGVRGYGLVVADDYDAGPPRLPPHGYSTFFTVLLIGFAKWNQRLQLFKFSSIAGGLVPWHVYDCRQPAGVPLWAPYGSNIAVIASGTAQWLVHANSFENQNMYTLDVSINSGRIAVTMLQFDELARPPIGSSLPNVWLCSIDARPLLLCVRNNQLQIWSRQNQNGALRWRPTRSIQVGVEMGMFGESLAPVCTGENTDTVLALYHSDPRFAYLLDLQSGSATKVAGWTGSFNYMTTVSFEINWPMFFRSRLRVQL